MYSKLSNDIVPEWKKLELSVVYLSIRIVMKSILENTDKYLQFT